MRAAIVICLVLSPGQYLSRLWDCRMQLLGLLLLSTASTGCEVVVNSCWARCAESIFPFEKQIVSRLGKLGGLADLKLWPSASVFVFNGLALFVRLSKRKQSPVGFDVKRTLETKELDEGSLCGKLCANVCQASTDR